MTHPTPFEAEANRQAAIIAAREVRAIAAHSEEHRQSLEAWRAGEREWPWPDCANDRADEAVRSLLPSLLTDAELLRIQQGHRVFDRLERRTGGRA